MSYTLYACHDHASLLLLNQTWPKLYIFDDLQCNTTPAQT